MKKTIAQHKKILMVEDEESIRMFCQRVLAGEGIEVDIVPNGQAGKAKIETQKYDLYIFDFKMPLMSGMELYKWMEKTFPESTNRVLFITGSVIGDDSNQFVQNSGRPVLFKPFSMDELKGMVQSCLNEAQQYAQHGNSLLRSKR
jgi:DNA-binding response OmpR family regulator